MTTADHRPASRSRSSRLRPGGRRDAAPHDAAGGRAAEAVSHRRAQPGDPGALPHHRRLHPQLRRRSSRRPRGRHPPHLARCGCEYEWGVHATAFGRPLGFTDEQLRATVHGTADDPAWSTAPAAARAPGGRAARHRHASRDGAVARAGGGVADAPARRAAGAVGFYHLVSFMANGARRRARGLRRAVPGLSG